MMRLVLGFLTVICVTSCSPTEGECDETNGRLRPIALSEFEVGRSRLHGFAGAAPAGTVGNIGGQAFEADESGAFTVEFDASYNDEVSYSLGDETLATQVKRFDETCAVQPLFNAGTLPNDIEAFRCGDEEGWLVPDSAENALVFYGSASVRTTLFEGEGFDEGSGPHSVVVADALAVVSLFEHGGIALVDPCDSRILDVARPRAEGEPVILNVSPSLELAVGTDVDGDGESETTITRMLPAHPQGLAAEGNEVFVAYSNFLQSSPTALYGPGYVASFRIEDQRIVEVGGFEVDCLNVQSVASTAAGFVASCSGVLERVNGNFQSTSPGALYVFDGELANAPRRIDFGNFAPATPTLVAERLVVGSLLQKAVAVVPVSAASVSEGEVLTLGPGIDSIFDVTPLVGPLVLAPLFGEDRVVVIDVARLEISPWPFENGITLADDAALRGPLSLAKNDRDEVAVLMGLSAQVFQLRFGSLLETTP